MEGDKREIQAERVSLGCKTMRGGLEIRGPQSKDANAKEIK